MTDALGAICGVLFFVAFGSFIGLLGALAERSLRNRITRLLP